MKKVMEINGENFTIMKSISSFSFHYNTFKDIYSCYEKPSEIKLSIYKDWEKWFNELNCYDFGIISYNGWMFTCGGIIKIDGQMYYIYITKTRQEIYAIEN